MSKKHIHNPFSMKKIILTLFTVVLFNALSQGQDVPILVTAQWLHDHLKDPKVVVVQVNGIKFDYDDEHIDGARFLWPELLAPNSPDGNMNPPDLKKATTVIQSLGISNDSHVILCYVRGEIPSTARMFLTFEYLGMKGKVSILNGGLDAWKKAGYSISKELPSTKEGKFKPNLDQVIVDRQYVFNHLKSDGTTIIDARPTNVYNGDPTGFPRDGHIAGAKSLPYTEMFDPTNTFKANDQLQNYFNGVTAA